MAPDDPKNRPQNPMDAATLGIDVSVGMAFFSFVGYSLDKKVGNGQAFTFIGIFLGLVYVGYEIWRFIRKLNQSEKPPDQT